MPFDPEDILGATDTTDPGKGAKHSSPGFDPSDVKIATGATGVRNLIGGTLDPNTSFGDFRFQPKTNADNYLLRAQDQGFMESLGKTIGNTAANIPLDIVQGVGYLGTLFEMGDDRDYTNALVREIDKIKNPMGQVYTEHPDQYFDMKDSAWWMNNLSQLVESSASFAVEGAGIAELLGTAAKTAAWSTRAAKLGLKAAQGISAATLTYMEGAMSGAQVFETAYNNNYMKFYHQGMDPAQADQQARHIASQAAAATVQIHTALNLGLNLTELTPLFREPDEAIVRWWRKNGTPESGETPANWSKRITDLVPENMPLKKLLGLGLEGPSRLGLETLQEGVEEVNTQYAEHVGKAIGEQKEDKDVTHSLLDADRYFKEVLNQEGALNMVLGSLGGLAQTVLLDHIPIRKVIKYGPDGKPLMTEGGQLQTERVSAHTMNEHMNREYFDNIKDALSKDMNWFAAKNKDLHEALKNKDLDTLARTRADILSVHNLRAISMGLGDIWKNQYQDIADLDNTQGLGQQLQPQLDDLTKQMQDAFNSGDTDTANQLNQQRLKLQQQQQSMMDTTDAMQKGFAENKDDNAYKLKAQKATENLDYLTKLYHDMQDKFTGTPEMEQSGLAEHMFYRQANLYLHKQQLNMMEEDLTKLKSRVDQMTLSGHDDMLVKQGQQFLADKEVWDSTTKKLNGDITRLNEAVRTNNNKTLLQLLDKYKIPAREGAHKQLVNAIEARKKELQTRAEQTNKDLSDTVDAWKLANPTGNVEDVMKKASERPVLEDLYQQNRTYLQQGLAEYETARQQLASDSTEGSIRRFLKENQPDTNKTKQELDKQHIEAYNQQMDREIAAGMDAKQKQQLSDHLTERINQVQKDLADKHTQLQELQRQGKNLTGFFKNISQRKANKESVSNLQSDIYSLQYELTHLTQRQAAASQKATEATQQAENTSRNPPPVVQPTTQVQVNPGSTPAENTQQTTTQEQQHSDQLPDFDFGQEAVPNFTNTQEGHPVFDRIVGGQEAGTTLRQFIQLRKDSPVEFLVKGVRTMLEKTNQVMPSEEEFKAFITPYVNALKNEYLSQKPTAEQDYDSLKSFLKPSVLTVLDILEGEFRQHGFSYDRALQVLNQQVKEGNLEKNLVGQVANRLRSYLEDVSQPVAEQPTNIQPAQEAISTIAVPGKVEMTDREKIREIQQKRLEELSKISVPPIVTSTSENIEWTKQERVDKVRELFKVGNVIKDGREQYTVRKREPNIPGDHGLEITNDRGEHAPGYGILTSNYLNDEERADQLSFLLYDNVKQKTRISNIEKPNLPEIEVQKQIINAKYDNEIAKISEAALQRNTEKALEKQQFNEQPATYIEPVTDSEPTTFSNAALDLDVVRQEQKRFTGAANIEAIKANFNTHPYLEFDNGNQISIVSDQTQLDQKLNTDVLLPGVITPGDNVTLKIDEKWAGEINYDTEMMQNDYGEQLKRADMFQNYLDPTGKIGMTSSQQHPKGAHANVPIQIIHEKTGKVIGYLPRADWILAKYPDTQNYRNVTDTYQDEGTEVTDNVARQYQRIMKLREAIVRSWNTDKSLILKTQVSKRGTGHVMINRDVNKNTGRTKLINRSAKNMLPDSHLEIAIMKQGTAYVGSGIASEKQLASRLPEYMKSASSLPIAMLPSPDGTHVPTPLYTHRLGDNPGSMNTVVSAIELYLRSAANMPVASDTKAILKIRETTGFDLRSPDGLRNFIQQYFTYTQKFGEKDTVITPSEVKANANPQFMLDIPDLQPGEQIAFIKAGTSFSGEKPVYAQLLNGKLHPDFEQALREGLQDRFKNVVFAGKELRGINSQGEFKAPTILTDGTVRTHTYQDYNEFVKANSMTFAYGLNKVGNQYVYMANPVIQLDYDQALKGAPPVPSTTLQQQQKSEDQGDLTLPEEDELADLFGNGMLSPAPSTVTPITAPAQGEQVSLELLQELRNLTPEAHRNTQTPEQVLKELLERGVTVLAEGHNPFYIC